MKNISPKEANVLRALLKDSSIARKNIAMSLGMTEPDLSKTITKLKHDGVITKHTIDLNYDKLGYPDIGIFIFSVSDKKNMKLVADKLLQFKEIIEIHEVFGDTHDMIVRIMAENNHRIREICDEISNFDEVRAEETTFTIIFARTYKLERGVPV